MIRVLLADDQEMVRAGIEMMLTGADDIEVVASVSDGRAAVEAAHELRPDVCLLDVRMPQLDGVSSCRAILSGDSSKPRVVIVTTFDDDQVVDDALAAGASGFLLKTASAALIIEAIRAADSGDQLIAPEITTALLRRLVDRPDERHTANAEPVERLSEREEEVVQHLAEGLTNAELAERLHLSVATIKTHVNSILTKLGARNRVEIAAFAFRTGRVT